MRKDWNCASYIYRGLYIYKITNNDWCVFSEDGIEVHEKTLKAAKSAIDTAYNILTILQ